MSSPHPLRLGCLDHRPAQPHISLVPATNPPLPPDLALRHHDTGANLPPASATESSFLAAALPPLLGEMSALFLAREFAVCGYGRADVVFGEEGRGARSGELTLTAVEAKISDWRKGLQQAHRYKYFAHRSILLVPPTLSGAVSRHLALFRELGVGLWVFDSRSSRLLRKTTPRLSFPMGAVARMRAERELRKSEVYKRACQNFGVAYEAIGRSLRRPAKKTDITNLIGY